MDLLKHAEFVVDLTLEGFIHTQMLTDILVASTRVLFVSDPVEVLERNMPHASDKKAVEDACAMLESGHTMHIWSDAGTNLTARIDDSHPGFQCGFTDDAGRWDHWPSKMVMCWPKPDGVDGQVALQPGD